MSRQISFKRLRRSSGIGKYAAGSAPPVCTQHVYTTCISCIHSIQNMYILRLYTVLHCIKCIFTCVFTNVHSMYTQCISGIIHAVYIVSLAQYTWIYAVYMLCIQCVCALCIKPLSSYYLLLYIYHYVYHQFYM